MNETEAIRMVVKVAQDVMDAVVLLSGAIANLQIERPFRTPAEKPTPPEVVPDGYGWTGDLRRRDGDMTHGEMLQRIHDILCIVAREMRVNIEPKKPEPKFHQGEMVVHIEAEKIGIVVGTDRGGVRVRLWGDNFLGHYDERSLVAFDPDKFREKVLREHPE